MKNEIKSLIKRLLPREKASDFPNINVEHFLAAPAVERKGKTSIFSFACGRSGQRWISKVVCSHANAHGGCERFREAEAFFRWTTWNKLPVDVSGTMHLLKQAVYYDWNRSDVSISASPYFCFGIPIIMEYLAPDVLIFNMRDAIKTVNSIFDQGWYTNPIMHEDHTKAAGFEPSSIRFYHNFGRIMPNNDFLNEWNSLTRIGRISWYLSTVATSIKEQFEVLPQTKKLIFKLESMNQNYDFYLGFARELGLSPVLSPQEFIELKSKMSNAHKKKTSEKDWTQKEKSEFETMIAPYAELYESISDSPFQAD